MADTLVIFGDQYTDVTAIKATDSNNNVLSYIRPSGSINIVANGSNIDVSEYATANVSVSGQGATLQTKSVTPTESSQTISPDTGYDGLSTVTVGAISSTYVGSGIDQNDSTDLTVSGATVTAPAGYYATAASKSIASGSAATPGTSITANPTISVSAAGLITATASASQQITPTVSAGYVSNGTAGTVTVSGSNTQQLSTQAAATITPTESSQTAVAAGKYTTGAVTVGAISSTYVGSNVARNGSSDLSVSGATVTAPAGYYASNASATIQNGSIGAPTATKGTVSNNSVSVTPNVTYTAGYISAGSTSGTAVTVSASELVSGNKAIAENGTGIDVANYATVSVDVQADGDYMRSEVCPLTTFTVPSDVTYILLQDSQRLVDNMHYIITYDGVEYVCTCEELYGTDRFLGDITLSWGATGDHAFPFCVEDWNGNPSPGVHSPDKNQHTIKIEQLVLLNDGVQLQTKTVTPTTSQQVISPDTGYDALETVTVNAVPSGTAGTPTAAKGAVSNHSVSVTPSVTNTTGYITGGTINGSAVTVSVSELVSGNLAISENGTGIDVAEYSTVSVAVPSGSGKAVQIASGVGRASSSAYTEVSGQTLTVGKTGTYDVYWVGYRSSTGGTNGSALYIDDSAHSSGNQTTFNSTYTNVQNVHLTNVSLTKDQVITVRARSRGNNYYMYIMNLVIIEA